MFSLLGLRQLYFLIDGLLDRLVYLTYGLAAVLGFIGVKLGLLAFTVIASLVSTKGKAQNAVAAARRHAIAYLDVETDPAGDKPPSGSCPRPRVAGQHPT